MFAANNNIAASGVSSGGNSGGFASYPNPVANPASSALISMSRRCVPDPENVQNIPPLGRLYSSEIF